MQAERKELLRSAISRWINPVLGGAGLFLVALALLFVVKGWTPRPRPALDPAEIGVLARLPLQDLGAAEPAEGWDRRIGDALDAALAELEGVTLLPQERCTPYAGSLKPLSQIAQELEADTLLIGTVLRRGDQLRLRIRVERPRDGEQVFSARLELLLGGDADPAELLAQEVLRRLRARMAPPVSP